MSGIEKKAQGAGTKAAIEASLDKDPKAISEMARVGKDILKGAAEGAVKGAVIGAISGALAEANKAIAHADAIAATRAAKPDKAARQRRSDVVSSKDAAKKQRKP